MDSRENVEYIKPVKITLHSPTMLKCEENNYNNGIVQELPRKRRVEVMLRLLCKNTILVVLTFTDDLHVYSRLNDGSFDEPGQSQTHQNIKHVRSYRVRHSHITITATTNSARFLNNPPYRFTLLWSPLCWTRHPGPIPRQRRTSNPSRCPVSSSCILKETWRNWWRYRVFYLEPSPIYSK